MPAPAAWHAPRHWICVDFISDLHLSAQTPRAFVAWRDYLRSTPADAVVILGDLFDAWVGDDARHEGFEAEAAAVLREGAARRTVAFMVGNRDFLLGPQMLQDCGVRALPDPTLLHALDTTVLLTHGDALCIDDVEYQAFRHRVRDPRWQAEVLGQSLEQRRALARGLRSASQSHQRESQQPPADVDAPSAAAWMAQAGTHILVHGHTHRPASHCAPGGLTRHVLSDWELDGKGVPRAQVLRWSGPGWTRLSLLQASAAA